MQHGSAAVAGRSMLPDGDTALRPLTDDGRLKLMRAACLPAHGGHLPCSLCMESCPVSALAGDADGTPVADDAACLGCGRCVVACPTGALAADGFGVRAAHGRTLNLDCVRAPADGPASQVRCLGGVTVDVVLELAGIQARVVLRDRGWCTECPAGAGDAAPWADALDEARALLAEAGVSEDSLPIVEAAPLPPRKARPLAIDAVAGDRRTLLRQATLQAPVEPDLPAGRRRATLIPRTRHRRLKALRTITAHTGGALPSAMRVGLTLAEGCDGRLACVAFCPTGALSRTDVTETTAALSFGADDCISCGRCAEGCTARALRLTSGAQDQDADAAEPGTRDVLRTFEMARCRACGAEFTAEPGEERCSSCRVSAGLFLSLGLFGGR